ncbi:hypothetical protein N1851_025852 [Merluccius polli]|uniref:Uncharacterized protein n=1 Tax=Merluccius polli TaxID=89951 RepID=A0AA47NUV1_MERPO|nr:hypothetical protein N1851_025852 [Merluccius polli]
MDVKREVVLRCLMEYIGDRGEELIKDNRGAEVGDILEDIKVFPMKIYVCREPDNTGIILEGLPVLTGVSSVARACCLLLGLAYAVNLEYPVKLQHTFEVFQRLFMGLDPKRPKQSPKYITLKNKLLT